jgi:hypothetical protein
MTDLFLQRGARLSPCRRYRYRLWRTWDDRRPPVVYIMLNPSIADEQQDDATITRCIRRAENLGAGGIIVMNLFSLVSTKPRGLYTAEDPVGPETDAELLDACRGALHVICGRGNHGAYRNRAAQLLSLLRANDINPKALHINDDGSPKHPLYIGYDAPLIDIPDGSPPRV